MTRYSVQPRAQIFVKAYGFLSFARNMRLSIGKIISKNCDSKYGQRLLDPAVDAIKIASKIAIQKTAKATGDLIGDKIADEIVKVSRTSPQNSLVAVESETEKRQPIINDLRLMQHYNNGISNNSNFVRKDAKSNI